MRKWLFGLLFFILFTFGCTKQEATQPEEPANEETKETIAEADEKGAATDLMKTIENIRIPETLEEWLEAKPGLLVQDNPRDSETTGWPSMIMELDDESKQYLDEITTATKDVDQLFKALIYLYGNAFYSIILKEQIDYSPTFAEPYLPEPELVVSSDSTVKTPNPDYAILLLDASSSMLSSVDNQQKMTIAKNAVKRFAHTLGSDRNLSLIVYGHGGTQSNSDKQLSCSTIDELVPMGPYNEESFVETVDGVQAKGWTPLASAIKKAHQASLNYDGNIIIYIVSDGLETCDGDPIKEAQEFVNNPGSRHVNIIGFDVDQEAEDQLKAVAEAGNGEYISADTIEDLNASITQKWVLPSLIDIRIKQMQSPKNGMLSTAAKLNVQLKHDSINFSINRETSRFRSYINLMKNHEMISEELHQQLLEKNEAYAEKLKAINATLETEKLQKIEEDVERIDQSINDWAERMNKLQEAQE